MGGGPSSAGISGVLRAVHHYLPIRLPPKSKPAPHRARHPPGRIYRSGAPVPPSQRLLDAAAEPTNLRPVDPQPAPPAGRDGHIATATADADAGGLGPAADDQRAPPLARPAGVPAVQHELLRGRYGVGDVGAAAAGGQADVDVVEVGRPDADGGGGGGGGGRGKGRAFRDAGHVEAAVHVDYRDGLVVRRGDQGGDQGVEERQVSARDGQRDGLGGPEMAVDEVIEGREGEFFGPGGVENGICIWDIPSNDGSCRSREARS